MIDKLNEMLRELRADSHLEVAAIAADGGIVAISAQPGYDTDTLAGVAGDGFMLMAAVGGLLQKGEPTILTVEYDAGTLLVCALEPGAELVVIGGPASNVGLLRVAVRHFQAQYLQATALVA